MNIHFNKDIDRDIKESLKNKADEVSVPENMFFKVRNEILKEESKGVFNMKFKFLKSKTALIAGILCIATTVTCVASTNIFSWISSSSHLTEIRTFPSADSVKEKVGFLPKYVETFDGGFKFDSFNYSNDEKQNDKGDVISKSRSANFDYTKNGAQKNQYLSISAQKIDEKNINSGKKDNVKDSVMYNGIEIKYSSYKYKAVPPNYEITEEESELCEKGLLQIGYGADTISESNMKFVIWYDSGIEYSILNCDYNDVNEEEMINMSKKIIDQK